MYLLHSGNVNFLQHKATTAEPIFNSQRISEKTVTHNWITGFTQIVRNASFCLQIQKGHGICQPSITGFHVALEWNLYTEICCQEVTNTARQDKATDVLRAVLQLKVPQNKAEWEHKNAVDKNYSQIIQMPPNRYASR